eukprot:jgi/Chrzof1/15228/Cz09g32070.t1_LHC4[v5.2]
MASALATRQTAFAGRTARVCGKASRCSVRVMAAAARRSWLPGAPAPSHLKGELAGDFGFDPLNLGRDETALRWYQQAELVHGRTAMAAVAGILIPSILNKVGVTNVPEWYEAGKASMESGPLPYFGPLVVAMHYLYGFVEIKRLQDFRKPGSQAEPGTFLGFESSFKGVENGYPGGIFDPLGLSRESPEKFRDLKEKEVKNGRLAMLAFLGFVAQHYARPGTGPIDNLVDHVKDPWHTTFVDNGVSVPGF